MIDDLIGFNEYKSIVEHKLKDDQPLTSLLINQANLIEKATGRLANGSAEGLSQA